MNRQTTSRILSKRHSLSETTNRKTEHSHSSSPTNRSRRNISSLQTSSVKRTVFTRVKPTALPSKRSQRTTSATLPGMNILNYYLTDV